MRLVSAVWGDFYPFDEMDFIKELYTTNDPSYLKDGDVLLVWGGEDIHPALYNHGRSRMSGANWEGPSLRDRTEWMLMTRAIELKLPIIGICRGAQMLCARAGGYLVQHANNHGTGAGHEVKTIDGKTLHTNTLHHQMMVPDDTNHKLIAWTEPRSDVYHVKREGGPEITFRKKETEKDPEFVHFTDINGFAIQWHPEFMKFPNPSTDYVINYLTKEINK